MRLTNRDKINVPLLALNLKLDKSCLTSPVRTTAPESYHVKWSLKVNNVSGNWYLKIERNGQKGGDPLYCLIDINGPDFAFYFEYYFTVETYYIMLIPKISFDEEDPSQLVNITCKVLKRMNRWDFRAEALNVCSETLEWDFPTILLAKKTWSTGFCLVIKSHTGRSYAFEVVLHESGIMYFQTQRAVPGDVHLWGSFHKEPPTNFNFSVTLKRGDLREYVCDVKLPWFPHKIFHHTLRCTLYVRADIRNVTN